MTNHGNDNSDNDRDDFNRISSVVVHAAAFFAVKHRMSFASVFAKNSPITKNGNSNNRVIKF